MDKGEIKNEIKTALRKYLPWFVTILIFIFLFDRVPFIEVIENIKRVNLKIFVPLLSSYVLFFFFWDSFVCRYVFSRFGVESTYREMLTLRGATYLLSLLGYMVGQGGLALIMSRAKKVSIAKASSIVILYLYLDFYTLLAFCLAGAFRLDGVDIANFFQNSEAGGLVRFLIISWIVFAAQLFFFRRLLPASKKFDRIKRSEALSAFREAPVLRYVQIALLKSPIFITGIVFNYLGLMSFGVHVPFFKLATMMPLVWLIGSIPVTVMRMGTIQAAMIWLVVRYATGDGNLDIEAAVLAFSLLWESGLNLGRFIIGAISVTRVPKSVWMPRGDSAK